MSKEEINEKEEIVQEKHYSFGRIIFKMFIFIVLIISLFVIYSKYLGTSGLIVKEYRVESSILTNNFNGVKVVHFSDLLYGTTVNKNEVKSLVSKINELNPDIVVFTGDLIGDDYKLSEADKTILIENLSLINTTIGKYAIYGENDYNNDDYDEIMNDSKFNILNNSYDEIFYKSNESLYLVGIPSSIKTTSDLNSAFEFYSDEVRKYTIVLVHDGKTIKSLDESNYEVDLILGGHSLNGSVVLPIYGGVFKDDYFYKYYDNYYEKGITKIFISSGLGTNKYKYRFNNKPSINLYRLKAQS